MVWSSLVGMTRARDGEGMRRGLVGLVGEIEAARAGVEIAEVAAVAAVSATNWRRLRFVASVVMVPLLGGANVAGIGYGCKENVGQLGEIRGMNGGYWTTIVVYE